MPKDKYIASMLAECLWKSAILGDFQAIVYFCSRAQNVLNDYVSWVRHFSLSFKTNIYLFWRYGEPVVDFVYNIKPLFVPTFDVLCTLFCIVYDLKSFILNVQRI